MILDMYGDVKKYSDDVMDLLMKYEIQNNLIISNCLRGIEGMDAANWFMSVIRDADGSIRLIALMTPPHNMVVYEIDNQPCNEAVELLTHEIMRLEISVPGIVAEKSLAIRLADKFSNLSGKGIKDGMHMRIYRLDKVNDIPKASGRLRQAGLQDLYYLPYWQLGFNFDCSLHIGDVTSAVEKVKWHVGNGDLYVWEDDIPVSQAARRTL